MTRRVFTSALASALLAAVAPARAQQPVTTPPASSVAACATAADEGQAARNQGRLLEAMARFSSCSQPACPALVQADCVRWGAELDAAVPSVIVAVRDAGGTDVLDAELTIDGAVVPIDAGRAVRLDPGRHSVAVARGRTVLVRSEFALREREVSRRIDVVVGDARPVSGTAPPEISRTVAPWVLVGGAAIGLVGAGVAWSASQRFNDLDASCAPRCATADVDGLRTRALVADVTIGVGVVAAAVGLYLLLRPSPSPAAPRAATLAPRF